MAKKPNARRVAFFKCAEGNPSPQEYLRRLRTFFYPNEKQQSLKMTVPTRADGAMMFLAGHIVKQMNESGHPAIIHTGYRPPEVQNAAFNRKASKAKAWQSPHQFWEAVDIVHPSLFWDAKPPYWKQLGVVTKNVAAQFRVPLEWGGDWGWDYAHVEIDDWRQIRVRQEREYVRNNGDPDKVHGYPYYQPSPYQRELRFIELIPREYWTREQRSKYPAK